MFLSWCSSALPKHLEPVYKTRCEKHGVESLVLPGGGGRSQIRFEQTIDEERDLMQAAAGADPLKSPLVTQKYKNAALGGLKRQKFQLK